MPTWNDVLYFYRFIERRYSFDQEWNPFAIDTRANPRTGERVAFVYDAALTVTVDARPHEAA
jgi:hypothetical protein